VKMASRRMGWAFVIGFGALNGYVTFKPALEARALEKLKEEERLAADLGPNMVEIPTQQIDDAVIDGKETRKGRGNLLSTAAWSQDDA